jgi:hypothetical protein
MEVERFHGAFQSHGIKKESPVSTMNKNEQLVYEIIKSNGECNIGLF